MIQILQTEFFRLKKSALFWSLFCVVAVLPLFSVLINLLYARLLDTVDIGVEFDSAMEYIKSLNITGAALSALPSLSGDSLFALICTSIFLSKEFTGGTFRNMLLANRSRRDIYLSFMIVAVTIGATYMGVNYVSTLLFNGIMFGFGTMSATSAITACIVAPALALVSVIFLQCIMCLFLFGTRKLAVSLACPLVICILAPSFIVSFVEVFAAFGKITETDMSWIPLYNLNLLNLTAIDGALIGKILLYLVPLGALFGFLGWITFQKADLQ